MEKALLLFLVLFPLLASAWVYPLRRRSREYRNRLIQIVPLVELAAALLLLLWPEAACFRTMRERSAVRQKCLRWCFRIPTVP